MNLVNYYSLLILLVISTSLGVEEVHEVDHADELHNFLLNNHGLADNPYMNENSAQFFLDQLQITCLTAGDVTELIGVDNTTNSIPFESFARLAIYSLRQEECVKLENVDDIDMDETTLCRNNVSAILRDIRNHDRIELSTVNECFSAIDLIEDECIVEKEAIDFVYIRLLTNMVFRYCILPEPASFIDGVFSQYNDNDTSLNTTEFSELLHDLGIGEVHEAEEGHDDHEDHADHEDHTDHEEVDEHAGHDHRRRKRAEDEEHAHEHDHEEHGDEHEEHEETNRCYSSDEFISMALNDIGADSHVKELSKDGFKVICPALLQQVLSGACEPKTTEPSTPTKAPYTRAQQYGYGTASVMIISLLAFVGLLLFKGVDNDDVNLLMQFFVALGIGTLSGDAVLHIIPEVVGLHAHGGAEEEEAHDHEEEDKTYLWRLAMVIAGIYLFYLFENVLKLWNRMSGSNIHFHAHAKPCDDEQPEKTDEKSLPGSRMTSFTVHKNSKAMQFPTKTQENDAENGSAHSERKDSNSTQNTEQPHESEHDKRIVFWGITAVGVMVWIGDALHNFGDGIALGAAFSTSWVSGVGTSIAIFCHELPHEFGDFAIYIANGMSKWKALFMNFFAACFSFIGLYIGLALGQGEAREWLLAVIAGMFLYISLVDIMHEMVGAPSSRPIMQFLVQNLGLLLGWVILLLLALYEDAIIDSLSAS